MREAAVMAGTTGDRAAALAALGLTREATPTQVTAAYRRLARTTHPDRCADEDAGARFAALADAYRRVREEGPVPPDAPGRPAPDGPVRIRFTVGSAGSAGSAGSVGSVGSAQPDLIAGPVHVRPAGRQDRSRPTTKEGWGWT